MDFIQGNKHLSIDPSGIIIKGSDNIHLMETGNIVIGDINQSNNTLYPLQVEKMNIETAMSSAYYLKSATASETADEIFHTNNSLWDISVYSNGYIRTSNGLLIDSDNRIKKDIEDVPDNFALYQVNNIETKYYNYIDPMKKKQHKVVGFIAQNVKEYLPNAVTLIKHIIPDELRLIENINYLNQNNKFKLTINDLVLNENHTGKCCFYVNCNNEHRKIILDVENDKKSFLFDKEYTEIYLYGKEVNDFHSLDKNMIFALHHSAIQELNRLLNIKDEKIKSLESRLATIEAAIVTLQNK